MFVVRPVARDDLPAVLALSERTGTGLTTLPASRDRLAGRIERSIASFAGTADRAEACYVFVLADAGAGTSLDRVVGIGDYRGTYRKTGKPMQARVVHVWQVEGGLVRRFEQFTDTLLVAQAMR